MDFTANYTPLDALFQIHKDSLNVPKQCPISNPVNGLDIRCGPILRLAGTHENNSGNYRASILLVLKNDSTTAEPVITYVKGAIGSLSNNSVNDLEQGEFPKSLIENLRGYSFWKFYIDFKLAESEQKVRYTINGSSSKTFEFFMPRLNQSMNVMSYSCNGFSLATETKEYNGSLWFDVMRHHYENQPYHVMIGGGDQVYCDAIKNSSKVFKKWLTEKNPIKKLHQKMTAEIHESFENFYMNQYLSWFGKGFWIGTNGSTLQSLFPLAMTSIPSINIFDDHDIIDGFGSYRDSTMSNEIFRGVGTSAYRYYMLFQQQVSLTEKDYLEDPSWILSNKRGPYIQEKSHSIFAKLGSEVAFLGLDCRTERKLKQIVTDETYKIVFDRLSKEVSNDSNIKHLLVLLGVPIAYPRLVWLEWLLNSPLLAPAKSLAQRGIIAKGLVNEFDGSVEVLDDLEDHWCSKHHKKERNHLVGRLQEFGSKNGVRITILSGDVHLAALGRFKSKLHLHHFFNQSKYEHSNQKVLSEPENDPRLMFNLISSAIVNAPPPNGMATLLNKRSKMHHFDKTTDEDMIPLFVKDVDDSKRENREFLNRRNWSDLIPIGTLNQNGVKPGYEINSRKLPGPTFGEKLDFELSEERDLSYKITENSLVATIHVEKNHQDVNSISQDYELIVPELLGKYHLQDIGVKE